jgi:hypothetical protein
MENQECGAAAPNMNDGAMVAVDRCWTRLRIVPPTLRSYDLKTALTPWIFNKQQPKQLHKEFQ